MASLVSLTPAVIANEQPGTPFHEQREVEKPSLSMALNLKDSKSLEITLRNDGHIPLTVFKKAPTEVLASKFNFCVKNDQGETLYQPDQLIILYELQAGTTEQRELQPGETITYTLPMENIIPQETLKQLPPGPKTLLVEYCGLKGEFDRKSLPAQSITLE